MALWLADTRVVRGESVDLRGGGAWFMWGEVQSVPILKRGGGTGVKEFVCILGAGRTVDSNAS